MAQVTAPTRGVAFAGVNDDFPDLAAMRVGYGNARPAQADPSTAGADGVAAHLDPVWLADGWLPLFRRWLAEAVAARIPEPNAMVLGTVDADGCPATRTVLCKGADERGVVFFTNYDSDKGRALAVHPVAAVTFPWIALERQVHVRGGVTRVAAEETYAYWSSRPRGSQLSAYASAQSRPVADRAELERAVAAVDAEFAGRDVPVPPGWGGYRIAAEVVEFWQGRADRLHNRVRVTHSGGAVVVRRLAP